MTHNLPKIIGKQRRDRTLVLLYWRYGSKKVIISEEQLIYNSKDLVAWIGGALGIFVGYSFFNLSQHIIAIVFYLFPTKSKMYDDRPFLNAATLRVRRSF